MIDLENFKGKTALKYVVNHREETPGDYTNHYYDIVAVMSWGGRTICGSIENPYDAIMFAAAPEMIEEIKELRSKVDELEKRISLASNNLIN